MNGENENQPALDLNEELSERFGRIEMWAEELGITQRFIRQKLKGCLGITGRDKEGIVHKRAYYSESTIRRVLAGQLWPDFAERLKIWIVNNPTKWIEDTKEEEPDKEQIHIRARLSDARNLFVEGKLPQRCIQTLEKIGFAFGRTEHWNNMFIATKKFRKGNGRPPFVWTGNSGEFLLAAWEQEERMRFHISKIPKRERQIPYTINNKYRSSEVPDAEKKQIEVLEIDLQNPEQWEEMYNRVVSLSQSNTHDWYCNKRFYKITRWLEEQFVLHHSNALRPDQSEKILKLNSVFKFLKYKKIDWAMPDEFSLAEFLALHGRFPTSEEPKYSDEERTRKWIYTCGLLARKNRLPKIVRKNLAELGVHFLVLGETFTTRLIKPFDAQLCREES